MQNFSARLCASLIFLPLLCAQVKLMNFFVDYTSALNLLSRHFTNTLHQSRRMSKIIRYQNHNENVLFGYFCIFQCSSYLIAYSFRYSCVDHCMVKKIVGIFSEVFNCLYMGFIFAKSESTAVEQIVLQKVLYAKKLCTYLQS